MTKNRTSLGTRAGGFTLMELLVVIGVIALVASLAIPGIMSILNAGADSQAYNLFAAELSAARSVAVRNSNYCGVHVQLAYSTDPNNRGSCFAALVSYNRANRNFDSNSVNDYLPKRMPGTMAFGEISSAFVDNTGGTTGGQFINLTAQANVDNFTSFTIVFAPTGTIVQQVRGQNILFNISDALFATASGSRPQLWDSAIANNAAYGNTGEVGMAAVTLFDYKELDQRTDATSRATYLNTTGQFIPVNVNTGQLFPRE